MIYFIPPENRKPEVFQCFQGGGVKGKHWPEMG